MTAYKLPSRDSFCKSNQVGWTLQITAKNSSDTQHTIFLREEVRYEPNVRADMIIMASRFSTEEELF